MKAWHGVLVSMIQVGFSDKSYTHLTAISTFPKFASSGVGSPSHKKYISVTAYYAYYKAEIIIREPYTIGCLGAFPVF